MIGKITGFNGSSVNFGALKRVEEEDFKVLKQYFKDEGVGDVFEGYCNIIDAASDKADVDILLEALPSGESEIKLQTRLLNKEGDKIAIPEPISSEISNDFLPEGTIAATCFRPSFPIPLLVTALNDVFTKTARAVYLMMPEEQQQAHSNRGASEGNKLQSGFHYLLSEHRNMFTPYPVKKR